MVFSKVDSTNVIDPNGGSNQTLVRAYNERLVLSLVRRHGSLPKSEIARRTGLSAQTASVIMRSLERDGLLIKGAPRRGKVGQPSIPMALNPDGVYAFGLKIGRRSAQLYQVNFLGEPLHIRYAYYAYPVPEVILKFARKSVDELSAGLNMEQKQRIAGIGVAMPFELWNWAEKIDAPNHEMHKWYTVDFQASLQEKCPYPIFVQNDATAACGAELVFGRGSELADFVYFYIGTFIGGGVVLNHAVYAGRSGNAGALGSMPVIRRSGTDDQLIDHASVLTLEKSLNAAGIRVPTPRDDEGDGAEWHFPDAIVTHWVTETSKHLAIAVVSSCSVIDFEAVIIDGDIPEEIKDRIVRSTLREMDSLNVRGIAAPQVLAGSVGRKARAIGAASLPLFSRYLLDQSILFKALS